MAHEGTFMEFFVADAIQGWHRTPWDLPHL